MCVSRSGYKAAQSEDKADLLSRLVLISTVTSNHTHTQTDAHKCTHYLRISCTRLLCIMYKAVVTKEQFMPE